MRENKILSIRESPFAIPLSLTRRQNQRMFAGTHTTTSEIRETHQRPVTVAGHMTRHMIFIDRPAGRHICRIGEASAV